MGLKNRIENNTNEIKKVNEKLKVLNGFIRPLSNLNFSQSATANYSATYTIKDNATYIFIHIPTTNKAITLRFGGTITSVDWGDGTTDVTLSHTYSATGDYVIKVISGTSICSYILDNLDDNKCVLKCYLSNSILSLNSGAFSNCYNLQQVVINADTVITIYSDTFSTDAYNTKFYVPDNLVEDYKVAINWVNFADRIYPLSSLGE